MGVLAGVRIVEVEGLGPAPFAGMLLADMGADVIVVHRKGGTPAPGLPERSVLDRGKRSIALDLKDEADTAVFMKLVARADALIEGFRPGVMERLGLGPESCHAVNPRLVFGRMTGWGQSGPLAHAAGHDLNYIAMSGALWYGSAPGQAPMTPATLVGDIGGGAMYLVSGVLAGILQAKTSGAGTVVDAAIYDGSAHMMNLLMALRQSGGMPETRGAGLLDGPHWSRTYACACGGYISVQSLEPQFYAEFLRLMGLEGEDAFQNQYDKALWPDLTQRLASLFKTRTRDHWAALFLGSDACVAPVLSPDEAMGHEMNAARQAWLEVGGVLQAAPAPRFEGKEPPAPGLPPVRGADGAAILAELGM
ncbi:CaiB/BaiF CoA-transferase family protein [uncultured Lentibacter sp.]|uniref:CaiB/BaiF CoA transferase family protein n=1 Tax=uncultured Lentibacter sp. TaxID=1659309 RepID=UPI002615FDFA|nr:CaiB/BaiF CoA-transferase family protein [uncultured Lentibacter sp.]